MSNQNKNTSKHSLATRILAIVLTVLVASGVVIYLVDLFVNLFSHSSEEESGTTHNHDDHLSAEADAIVLANDTLPFTFDSSSC